MTGPNTREAGFAPERVVGVGFVDFRLDRLLLVPGTYDLSASLVNYTLSHFYDPRYKALRFDVEPGKPYEEDGVVSLVLIGGRDPPTVTQPRQQILVATGDVLEAKMAGPAIRAWQIAIALSREHEVDLVSTLACDLSHPDFATGFADAVTLPDSGGPMRHRRVPGRPHGATPCRADDLQGRGRRHLRPVPPRGCWSRPESLAPADRRRLSRSTTSVLNEQLRARRLLPVRQRQAAGLLAGPARGAWAGSTRVTYDDDENLAIADRRRCRSACPTRTRSHTRRS